MLKRLTFFFSILLLVACSENKSGKMKDLDHIRSKSTYREKKVIAPIDDWKDTLFTIYNQDSVELNIQMIENTIIEDINDESNEQFPSLSDNHDKH